VGRGARKKRFRTLHFSRGERQGYNLGGEGNGREKVNYQRNKKRDYAICRREIIQCTQKIQGQLSRAELRIPSGGRRVGGKGAPKGASLGKRWAFGEKIWRSKLK